MSCERASLPRPNRRQVRNLEQRAHTRRRTPRVALVGSSVERSLTGLRKSLAVTLAAHACEARRSVCRPGRVRVLLRHPRGFWSTLERLIANLDPDWVKGVVILGDGPLADRLRAASPVLQVIATGGVKGMVASSRRLRRALREDRFRRGARERPQSSHRDGSGNVLEQDARDLGASRLQLRRLEGSSPRSTVHPGGVRQ